MSMSLRLCPRLELVGDFKIDFEGFKVDTAGEDIAVMTVASVRFGTAVAATLRGTMATISIPLLAMILVLSRLGQE
jgi:hypothetical protein